MRRTDERIDRNPYEPPSRRIRRGRPIVFRNATVITVDSQGVIADGDVLVVGDTIDAVGPKLEAPDGTLEIDASGGILTPGFVDSHRHMWQTALRGYGGDWALSQYFVFYYLQHGEVFRPEDIYAGNLLSALESVDTGVTTTLDWSHALRTPEYADAAVKAFEEIPGRFVLGYGNYLGAPWEWTAARVPAFVSENSSARDMLGCSSRSTCPTPRNSPRRGPSSPRATTACGSPRTPASGVRRPTTGSATCTTRAS